MRALNQLKAALKWDLMLVQGGGWGAGGSNSWELGAGAEPVGQACGGNSRLTSSIPGPRVHPEQDLSFPIGNHPERRGVGEFLRGLQGRVQVPTGWFLGLGPITCWAPDMLLNRNLGGRSDSTAGRAFILHTANPGLNPDTP